MSLALRAARGAVWTVISSMGGRIFGLVGTLIMTRFLHPEQIGEVADATILATSANWISIWGSASTPWSRDEAMTPSR